MRPLFPVLAETMFHAIQALGLDSFTPLHTHFVMAALRANEPAVAALAPPFTEISNKYVCHEDGAH